MKHYKNTLLSLQKSEKEMKKALTRSYAAALKEIKESIAIQAAKDIMAGSEAHMKIERLLSLQRQIENVLDNLYEDNLHKLTDYGTDLYNDKYYRAFYQIEDELKVQLNFSMIDERLVEAAVNYRTGGLTLSERVVGKNLGQAKKRVKETLVQAAITGESYSSLAEKLSDELGLSLNETMRILRTEGSRISSIATMDSIKEGQSLGVELKKQWLSTLDDRTRDAHAELDGQVVEVDEEFEMLGYTAEAPGLFGVPEMDINCRCDVITIVEGLSPDIRLDNITKDTMDFESYEEWYDNRVD